MFTPSSVDLLAILPEIVLTVGAGLLLLYEAFGGRRFASELTVLAILGAAWARFSGALPGEVWGGMLHVDAVASFVDLSILAAAALAAWMAGPYLRRNDADHGELYALLLLATVGAMVMASAVDALAVFLGLELLSIPLYVLNAGFRNRPTSIEAGIKYFIVGAFASAFMVYGIALLYGATTSTQLVVMGRWVVANGLSPLAMAGLVMVVGGLGFKLALFPFHAWAPDVYQGSPTPVTAFLSVVPKAAALITLFRVVDGMDLLHVSPRWLLAAGLVAVLSQTLGNIVAIVQRDVKRMLAYSGIAHMGYALVAVIASGTDGGAAVLTYLAAYTFMNVGAFAAVAHLSAREDEPTLISTFAGQGWRRPVVALAFTICLFSLAGIPPFVGFTAKFMAFRAAVNGGLIWLAVLGVVNSLISAFYYLRVVYVMYMQPLPEREPELERSFTLVAAGALAALVVVVAGIYPTPILSAAQVAVLQLVR